MPRYSGDIANAAGSALIVLDAVLPLRANWSIHDAAAGANAKVYKCAGDVTFYVWVGDNQTNYFSVRVWAAWDAALHTGSGSQTAAVTFCKYYPTYTIHINGNRFVFINFTTTLCYGCYCGLIKRADITKNLVLVYGGASATYYKTYNALAGFDDSTYIKLRLMEDASGTADVAAHPMGRGASELNHYIQDLDGRVRLQETAIHYPTASPLFHAGRLDGVVCLMQTFVGMPYYCSDIITVDGMDWYSYSMGTSQASRFLVSLED